MRVVVLILRGCPAGWLGAYGNEWVVTPHLDRIASESVVFDRHISNCPEAAGACRAWLGENAVLLEHLRARGIPTILVRANHPETDAPDWFYAGWGEVFDSRPQDEDKSPLDALLRTLPPLLDRIADRQDYLLWIEIDRLIPPWETSREVFEAYLHHEMSEEGSSPAQEVESEETDSTDETQEPIAQQRAEEAMMEPWCDPPTGPFDTSDSDAVAWLATSFGSVVTTLDSELGTIFEQLRGRGLDQTATWVITSDLGYPLGEHGQIGVHRPWLHEELVHTPLIVHLPAGSEAGRRVSALTQPADVADAIVDLLCSEHQKQKGLLELARGEVEKVRSHAVTSLDLGLAAERSIRTDEWALLLPVRTPEGETREPKLFQKPDDRWEVNDLRSRNIAVIDELEAILREG